MGAADGVVQKQTMPNREYWHVLASPHVLRILVGEPTVCLELLICNGNSKGNFSPNVAANVSRGIFIKILSQENKRLNDFMSRKRDFMTFRFRFPRVMFF